MTEQTIDVIKLDPVTLEADENGITYTKKTRGATVIIFAGQTPTGEQEDTN